MTTAVEPVDGETESQEDNRRSLIAALAELQGWLERHAESAGSGGGRASSGPHLVEAPLPSAPRLDQVAETFGLSPFERRVLLLAASLELDSSFASLCARAQGVAERAYPTFSLALAALPGAHWSALSPAGPLRYWKLVELARDAGVTGAALAVDERILHFLLGLDYRDEQLAGLAEPLPEPTSLVPSQLALARQVATTWNETVGREDFPVVQLSGGDSADKRTVAGGICVLLGLPAFRMPADALPLQATELDRVLRLWQREASLGHGVLVLDCDSADAHDQAREGAIRRVVEAVASPLILTSVKRRSIDLKPVLSFEVDKPSPDEQRELWRQALEESGAAGGASRQIPAELLERLVGQFHLTAPAIRAAAGEALAVAPTEAPEKLSSRLWNTCRLQARPRLDDLAQRIDHATGWPDLVLPEAPKAMLLEIASQVRWRHRVHHSWGFASRGPRGLGIAALFAGASGTGKTLAAEVIASEVGLDLYRIDLSSVVSKYIGETEKNLQRVFDAAEAGGAILLFDEADALFGKRTEVQDSHDRYANIEVSFLLQRMESYRGLAILTSNLKESLDPAFQRRFRFIVDFPFPGPEQRTLIWQRVFPAETPTAGLSFERLGRLNAAGGSIRNIAINAAFLAAAGGEPVTMRHLLRSARREFGKQGRTLPDLEVEGWV